MSSRDEKHIYSVEHPDGFFKIGKATDPYARVSGVQVGSPYELVYRFNLKYLPTRFRSDPEMEIHEWLSDCEIRGEWFDVEPHTVLRLFHRVIESNDISGHWITDVQREFDRMPEWKQNLGRKVDL